MIVMKIVIDTGVVDFGNGLIVDPRDTVAEFERKMPQKLLARIGEPGDSMWYMADSMYVSGLDMSINVTIKFDANEKLGGMTFYRSLTPEELEEGYILYATVDEKEYENYRELLRKLLNLPSLTTGVKFPWGTVSATLDNHDFDTDITIAYKKETEYERKVSIDHQENRKLSEESDRYIAALEQYKQHNSDLQGQKRKQEEQERLNKWQKDLIEKREAKRCREEELMEMFRTMRV